MTRLAPALVMVMALLALSSHVPVVSAEVESDRARFDAAAKVLQRKCVSCHHGEEPKGELSLETGEFLSREDLFDRANPAASHLLAVITPVDGKAEMPKESPVLAPEEIVAIRTWLEQGAPWPAEIQLVPPKLADTDWWSLQPLRRPPLPTLPKGWAELAANPIDQFVLATLKQKDLRPSPIADRATLIRRVYFDLLGLPPAPHEIDAFVHNSHPLAYQQLVDQLLASPQYGERWARHWLDVVHYGESHGYDKDKPRPNAWPYRDYVIRRLNADIPYERFVREQIAGDVWWPEDPRAIEATGFIAAGPWDFIGHAEVPETKIDGQVARNLDRDDMVTSTMNTFLSMTVQCARCHDHKFDPVSQEHYYSLQAVFAALDRADREYDLDPAIAAKRRELRSQLAAVDAQIQELDQQRRADLERPILDAMATWKIADHPHQGYHSAIAKQANEVKWVQIDLGAPQPIQSILLFPCHDDFAGIGNGFGFPLRYKVEASNHAEFPSAETTLLADHTREDFPNPGQSPVAIALPQPITARYLRVTATQLALRKDDYIFALAELVVGGPSGINLGPQAQVTSLDAVDVTERWRVENLVDGKAYQLQIRDAELPVVLAASLDCAQRAQQFPQTPLGQALAQAKQTRQAIEQQHNDLPPISRAYVGMIHHGSGAFQGTGAQNGKPRTIHVLMRGEVTQPGAVVQPGTVPIFPQEDWHFALSPSAPEGSRRQALADWLMRNDNPLTWRSIANRIWQYHFGTGIVGSSNDFGRMGELPTHPELLDWLACEFRDHGQSWKHLHRLILTSRTYQQTSTEDVARTAIDASNRYYWRMNRRALDAESIRDAMLAVAGALNPGMYGPSFQDFIVDKPEHSPHYEYDRYDPHDRNTHRRAIYRFLVRSQPQPFMDTLDCADPSQSVPRRQTTITALQALALLNNRFVLTMSEQFAARIAHETQDPSTQVSRAFQLIAGRSPTATEQTLLGDYYRDYGLINTCRCLLNLNEFVFVD